MRCVSMMVAVKHQVEPPWFVVVCTMCTDLIPMVIHMERVWPLRVAGDLRCFVIACHAAGTWDAFRGRVGAASDFDLHPANTTSSASSANATRKRLQSLFHGFAPTVQVVDLVYEIVIAHNVRYLPLRGQAVQNQIQAPRLVIVNAGRADLALLVGNLKLIWILVMSPFHGCLVVTSDMARIAHALLARGKAAANRNRHQSREELRSLKLGHGHVFCVLHTHLLAVHDQVAPPRVSMVRSFGADFTVRVCVDVELVRVLAIAVCLTGSTRTVQTNWCFDTLEVCIMAAAND
mmetsp:Transcript_25542/g.60898  ORF Transcript_25542/g.60898 Transcript_25542/m.60898 type:complete len:291 (+) Transcript_25542:73-945(+)